MTTASFWIESLGLTPLPEEGGMYKEVYRAGESIPKSALPARFNGSRSYSTSIYYLLERPEFSAFHRLNQDELWHFYDGSTLLVHIIDPDGSYSCRRMGRRVDEGEVLQLAILAGCLFAAEVASAGSYSLIGCTVAPGFEFDDFVAPARAELLRAFPPHTGIIRKLTRA